MCVFTFTDKSSIVMKRCKIKYQQGVFRICSFRILNPRLLLCDSREIEKMQHLIALLLGHWYVIMALYYVKSILTEISASRQERRVLQKSKIIRIEFLSKWGMLQISRYVQNSRNLEKNDFNRNLTVYCCVIQRLVTSDGSDGTQNDPGHPENEWE